MSHLVPLLEFNHFGKADGDGGPHEPEGGEAPPSIDEWIGKGDMQKVHADHGIHRSASITGALQYRGQDLYQHRSRDDIKEKA